MGMQDRDYARERKLDYTSKYDKKPQKPVLPPTNNDIPAWAYVVCGFIALLMILYVGNNWH